jgi:hypothetical protein
VDGGDPQASSAALVAIALAATAVVAWPTSDVSARGAAQTEPPAVVLLDGDFDGDGRTDIFWNAPGSVFVILDTSR